MKRRAARPAARRARRAGSSRIAFLGARWHLQNQSVGARRRGRPARLQSPARSTSSSVSRPSGGTVLAPAGGRYASGRVQMRQEAAKHSIQCLSGAREGVPLPTLDEAAPLEVVPGLVDESGKNAGGGQLLGRARGGSVAEVPPLVLRAEETGSDSAGRLRGARVRHWARAGRAAAAHAEARSRTRASRIPLGTRNCRGVGSESY